ncbi:MAG: hypothetical protein ABSE56_16115 [Bryobacteraceae bacterium]|jgi:hypothetical protein
MGKFSSEAVRRLNSEVDGKHRGVAEVAKEFLSQAGMQPALPSGQDAPASPAFGYSDAVLGTRTR